MCCQYCRSGGLPELVNALAKHYSPIYGRTIDPMKEVTVSVGVSEVSTNPRSTQRGNTWQEKYTVAQWGIGTIRCSPRTSA